MKKTIQPFLVLLVYMISLSCNSQHKLANSQTITSSSAQVYGAVFELKGNQMPVFQKKSTKAKPFPTKVYIFPVLTLDQLLNKEGQWCKEIVQKPIQISLTDSLGQFRITLMPGRYSIVVGAYEGYFVPFFNQNNEPAVFQLEEKQQLNLNIVVNSKVIY